MSFWSDLSDSLTGAGKRDLAAKQLEAQLELSANQLALEKLKAELSQSPAALKAKNTRYIVIAVILGILVFIIVKWMS